MIWTSVWLTHTHRHECRAHTHAAARGEGFRSSGAWLGVRLSILPSARSQQPIASLTHSVTVPTSKLCQALCGNRCIPSCFFFAVEPLVRARRHTLPPQSDLLLSMNRRPTCWPRPPPDSRPAYEWENGVACHIPGNRPSRSALPILSSLAKLVVMKSPDNHPNPAHRRTMKVCSGSSRQSIPMRTGQRFGHFLKMLWTFVRIKHSSPRISLNLARKRNLRSWRKS